MRVPKNHVYGDGCAHYVFKENDDTFCIAPTFAPEMTWPELVALARVIVKTDDDLNQEAAPSAE